ncbi:dihydrolipoyl dehydrogenase [Limoniibacter endophyticus]|uniref:Dihydrolipoyl dehydrogenase n=1 Tax=Limoniibacter endophyticus TaxID=1565040 RepID=A0A8J3GIB0_9HYPH|nr:dihydrolipoyl dehydrogenase [Limoniibacter endophyticus]GHC80274.1 dihydrolipoyl dehydrogenase [Limoniibacter endophyticus]
MKEISCKVLVIGAGPGGYVCAIRAGQLGLDTVIVDFQKPGGTCLNVGCIPSKALIHAADHYAEALAQASGGSHLGISIENPTLDIAKTVAWKDHIVGRLNNGVAGLLKKAKVKIVAGQATFRDGRTVSVETEIGTQIIHAENVVIATGSIPVELPGLPFGEHVLSSTQALSMKQLPQTMAVVGAGYIGLELGIAFAKMGVSVSIIEATDRILPLYDAELTKPVMRRLDALGVRLQLGCKTTGYDATARKLSFDTVSGRKDKIEAEKVLVTVGRKAQLDGWGREELELDTDGRFLRIDERCRTSMRGIHAIGDVTGEPMLAHRAMAQGEMVAEILAGHRRSWDKRVIPAVCFTDPEIVTAGLSPEDARKAGIAVKLGQFPYMANARAMTLDGEDGFVRIVAREDNHLVLGIQAVGKGVAELSAAFGLAIEMGTRLEDIAGTIHAHPTQGEGLQEAALKALGLAIHV